VATILRPFGLAGGGPLFFVPSVGCQHFTFEMETLPPLKDPPLPQPASILDELMSNALVPVC